MPKAFLFNPENDIALASGQANFTPPAAALRLRRAGRMLPFFLADEGDAVVCDGVNNRWFAEFRKFFGIKADIWPHTPEGYTPTPWGWSAAVRREFENLGFSADSLPSDIQLEHWRQLSHRRTAAAIARHIAAAGCLDLWPHAVEINDTETLRDILLSCGSAVVKHPWSSSGRGVAFFDSDHTSPEQFLRQAAGAIRRQGSVMVERFMSDHYDFALLYKCTRARAEYVGPSVFAADSRGGYTGNIVAPEEILYAQLRSHISGQHLEVLISALSDALTSIIAPEYDGPVGIDLCVSPAGQIHICESNLRYTMGLIARAIARNIKKKAAIL